MDFLIKQSKFIISAFCIGIVICSLILQKFENAGSVYFLDVGQGDSSLIFTEDFHTVLIDGGPSEEVLTEIYKVLPQFIKEIDLVILSHPHQDHIEGLLEVIGRYKIRTVLIAGDIYESVLYRVFLQKIKALKGTQLIFAGSKNNIIKFGSTVIQILHPFDYVAGFKFQNTNNASVVVKVYSTQVDGNTFLFTGDCETECEHKILSEYVGSNELMADVLKVGHHGSRTSTSIEFLNAVNPVTAIIQSARDNKFGHPHAETLEKLKTANVKVLRNDELGTIKVLLNP